MGRIDVISSCLVGMRNNASPISRVELTPWDLQFLPLDPIQKGIILLHKPQSQKTLIDHLKNSFSRALDFFPPLAGRLSTTKNDDNTICFFVDCNNAGAEFTHAAASTVSVSDILESKYIPKIVSSFFPLNGISNYEGTSKPLLGVQVTELIDGVFIGCTGNHAVVDGTSFWHFFNSWSEISRGLDSISKIPIFKPWFPPNVCNEDRLIRLPPLEQNDLLQNSLPPPLLERVFSFSKESLAKLKAKANAEAGTDNISSLQAVSAHLWRSYHRCRNSSHNVTDLRNREARLMMLIGVRTRIPLPDGYFGNGAYIREVSMSEEELLQNGLGFVARKMNELVAMQTRETVVKVVEDWLRNPELKRKRSPCFVIASSPRHNVYGCDFRWGKPVAVRSGKGQKFDGKVTVFPSAVEGGIDAEVCFAPETLEAMGDDAEFMEAFAI